MLASGYTTNPRNYILALQCKSCILLGALMLITWECAIVDTIPYYLQTTKILLQYYRTVSWPYNIPRFKSVARTGARQTHQHVSFLQDAS